MKAAYALGFLGLCATVLVIHVYDAPEEATKEVQDPFLASLEAHVVAKAQRRLRQRDLKEASQTHISEARKAIKAALLDAQSSSLHEIRQVEVEEAAADAKKIVKKAKKAAAKAAAPAGKAKKTFSWAELQRGDDAEEQKQELTQNKVSGLLGNLQDAPKANKGPEGTASLVGAGDDEVDKKAKKSDNALSGALSKAMTEAKVPKQEVDVEDNEVAKEQKAHEAEEKEEDEFEDDETFD